MKKGEITAFLSLIIILLVTFTGGLMESASVQMAKNYWRADVNRAMESVFAEYQKELLEEYDIFALEATYESGDYSEQRIIDRLGYFGAGNMEHEFEKLQLLTDRGAEAFRGQVTRFMQHRYGMDFLRDKVSVTDVWSEQEETAEKYSEEESREWSDFDGLLEAQEGELPGEDNPIDTVKELKKSPLLELIVPDRMSVSEKAIDPGGTLGKRELRRGYGDFSDAAGEDGALSKLLFGEYLLEHFRAATSEGGRTGALDYELEYICAGQESDSGNLKAVAKKLMLLRFGSDYLFLQRSASKRAEAESLAATLCTLAALPALQPAAAQVILLAWAYGETIMDLRSLLGGMRVPLVKSEESWQLSLSGLMNLQESGKLNDGKDSPDGMTYREYLRILLFLGDQKTLAMRALDMIEKDLQTEHGLGFFRADCCVSRLQMESTCRLRRGITYRFSTYYGYN